MKIYILVDGLEYGPFSKSEIFALMKEGSIGADAMGRRENQSEWQSLHKVLTSGSLGFFSAEQIAQQQEELPEAQILVPNLVPIRRDSEESKTGGKNRRILMMATAATTLAFSSGLLLIQNRSEGPPPTAEEMADAPPTSSQVEHSSSATAPVAEAAPSPVSSKAAGSDEVFVGKTELKAEANEPPPAPVLASRPAAPVPVAFTSSPAPLSIQTISVQLSTTKEITAAQMLVSNPVEQPRGVLILCPDQIKEVEKDIQNKVWLGFARNQKLALVTVAFTSPKELTDKKLGFMRAEDGSGAILLKGLVKANLDNLPVFIYGWGAGGTFVSSFANLSGTSVSCWAVFTDAMKVKPSFKDERPALIGCDYESTKVSSDFRKAFEAARDADLKWTWLSVAGSPEDRMPRFETFVRNYFAGLLANGSKNGVWVGTDSLEQLAFSELISSPRSAAWLPDQSLVAEWKQIMPTPDQRKDPIVFKKVVDTKVKRQPQITMFLRLPPKHSKDRPLRGTLAFCTWANDSDNLQKQLLYRSDMKQLALPGPTGVVARLIRYAEQHDLAVLTWTTSQVWSTQKSSDELQRKDEKEFDRNFDKLASAWENGVKFFARNHAMPDSDLLLYGISRGGQWAHRLALRKPDRFLAVHVHVPSTFDVPTPQAQKVLWLVTTGELEPGYERAIRFYRECRNLNYPMVFKAIVGLGHSDNWLAENLGFRFFDYALAMRTKRDEIAARKSNPLDREEAMKIGAWKQNFENPPFVGDLLNQDMFPLDEAKMVPIPLQVPLPNETIAQAWSKN